MVEKNYDELDLFLNKAIWSYKKYQNYETVIKNIIFDLLDEFNAFKLDFILLNISEDNEKLVIDKKKLITFIFDKKNQNFQNIKSILKNNNFKHVLNSVDTDYFLKNEVLIEVKFTRINNNKITKLRFKNTNNKILEFNTYKLSKFEMVKKKINLKLKKFINKLSNFYYIFKLFGFKRVFTFKKGGVYEVKYRSFKKILIESKDSINWKLRRPHLDIVTDNGKHKKIGDIINYFSNEINVYDLKVVETDMSKVFNDPIHLNKIFWTTGNNFFIYSIIFGFRHNVVPYKDVNKYILKNKNLSLYSYEYFSSLKKMNSNEISNFLKSNPIEITNNYITSGRHRGMALIGEFLRNKSDIKIFATLKLH